MTNSIEQFETWCHAHPQPHQGGAWAWPGGSLCEQLVNNAGGFSETFPTAQAAANASGPLDPDPNTAHPGHFGYFHDGGAGHVLTFTAHGVLMASHFVNSIAPGLGYLGTVTEYMNAYQTANGHPIQFLGHTRRHGTETLTTLTPAGGPSTPITGMRNTMRLLPPDSTGTYFLEVDGVGLYTVPNQGTADVLFRYLNATSTVTRADIDAAAAFVAGPPTYKTFGHAAAVTVDANALATALAPLIGHTDPTTLAAAVSTALAAQLAALPAQVVKAEGAALANG